MHYLRSLTISNLPTKETKMKSITFKLIQEAKKSGGDKYEGEGEFMIYIPQNISRPDGKVVKKFKITFEEEK